MQSSFSLSLAVGTPVRLFSFKNCRTRRITSPDSMSMVDPEEPSLADDMANFYHLLRARQRIENRTREQEQQEIKSNKRNNNLSCKIDLLLPQESLLLFVLFLFCFVFWLTRKAKAK